MNDNNIIAIKRIQIKGLWGYKDFDIPLDSKVNILAGINGSGKTTIFNIIEGMATRQMNGVKKLIQDATIHLTSHNDTSRHISYPNDYENSPKIQNLVKINTFDVPIKDKRKISKDRNQLDVELQELIDGNVNESNFVKLDSKLNSEIIKAYEQADNNVAQKKKEIIPHFLRLINSFFRETEKQIKFTEDKNIFIQSHNNNRLKINQLSAGEKQLLIILFTIFLQEQKPYIVLLDEPEISLHLSWQEKLIDTILAINPNCQLLIATHSPSIFGMGWGDKFINIDKL